MVIQTSSATATLSIPIYSTLGYNTENFIAECKVIQTSTAYSKIGIGTTQITGTNQGFGSLSNQYVYNGETWSYNWSKFWCYIYRW